MLTFDGSQKALSDMARGKFGRFCKFGTSQYGQTRYGDDDVYIPIAEYGRLTYGVNHYADIIPLSGIYRRNHRFGENQVMRDQYYITKNPRYVPQQATRNKFGDAVRAWQALTSEEKQVYNLRTIGKSLSGYNLFLREYLFSN
jgi:hypothetical protein